MTGGAYVRGKWYQYRDMALKELGRRKCGRKKFAIRAVDHDERSDAIKARLAEEISIYLHRLGGSEGIVF